MAEKSEDCNFFRNRGRRSHIRKRKTADSSSDESDPVQPRQPAKKTLPDNQLIFSSSSSSSKPEPELTKLFFFESSGEIQTHHDSRATAALVTETDFSRDARAIRERVLKEAEQTLKGEQGSKPGSDKLFKGIHGRREQTVAGEKAGGAHGPLRASARVDYQPDICKDYKETGYCGFGDACKFLHVRGDYKSGWQMEREWEEKEKAKEAGHGDGRQRGQVEENAEEDDEDEDALSFACFICRRPFENPIVTKCKHYFCEHCALKHHSKSKKCFVCNKQTLGIFNIAHEIRKKMAEEKKCVNLPTAVFIFYVCELSLKPGSVIKGWGWEVPGSSPVTSTMKIMLSPLLLQCGWSR